MRAELRLHTNKLERWRGLRPTGVAIAMLILVLGTLAACNSTPTHSSSSKRTVPTVTPPGQPSGIGPAPTSTPAAPPTATPDPTVLQVDFSEQYSAAFCTSTSTPRTTCVSTTGTGQDAAHGSISLSRTSVYTSPGSDSCSSATTQGTLTLAATGDTITFTGTGTFCAATETANFTYTITGGTGAYAHATGSGSINVPLPDSSSSGTETWTGSILTG